MDRPYQIVVGQAVSEVKAILARALRREMTPSERALWERLRNRRLGYKFRRQQIVDGFIADIYCHEAALVLETGGPVHENRRGYDAERDRIIEARGLTVLRVTNQEVAVDLHGTLARIRGECERRASP
ncbi:MAG: endonuclease domain-containing protein, partial [Gemmataceae bacterium]